MEPLGCSTLKSHLKQNCTEGPPKGSLESLCVKMTKAFNISKQNQAWIQTEIDLFVCSTSIPPYLCAGSGLLANIVLNRGKDFKKKQFNNNKKLKQG